MSAPDAPLFQPNIVPRTTGAASVAQNLSYMNKIKPVSYQPGRSRIPGLLARRPPAMHAIARDETSNPQHLGNDDQGSLAQNAGAATWTDRKADLTHCKPGAICPAQ